MSVDVPEWGVSIRDGCGKVGWGVGIWDCLEFNLGWDPGWGGGI